MTSDREPPVTGRMALARLAAQAIAGTDGVTATTGPGGRWQTVASQQTIPGVLAFEDARGRVELELHVGARWPPQMPLVQLGQQLRERVRSSAGAAGMAERLGPVSIAFDDVFTEPTSV